MGIKVKTIIGLLLLVLAPRPSQAAMVELFANGSASKNFLDEDNSNLTISIATGLAIVVIPHFRIEGRYTNISSLQDKLNLTVSGLDVRLTDIKTETDIYSLGVSIDFGGSTFQPYVYLGIGYLSTGRSYYLSVAGNNDYTFLRDRPQSGVTANVGLGLKLNISDTIALEFEAFGYTQNLEKKKPLVNLYGTAGLRIFI